MQRAEGTVRRGMSSRSTRVLAVLAVALVLGACRHEPRPVASSSPPPPSPSATSQPTPTPTPSRTAHRSPTARQPSPPKPGPTRACAVNEISVVIRTNKASYPPNDLIRFTITATNIGHVRCRVNLEGLYVRITDPKGEPIQMPDYLVGIPIPSQSGSPSASSSPASSSPPAGLPHDPEPYWSHDLSPGQRLAQECDWRGDVADPAHRPYGSKRADPGTYHATAHWQYPRVTSSPVAFRVDD